MTLKEKLINEIEQASDESILEKVLDFYLFLKSKNKTTQTQQIFPLVQFIEADVSDLENLSESDHSDKNCDDLESPLVHKKGDIWVMKAQGIKNIEWAVEDLREKRLREMGI